MQIKTDFDPCAIWPARVPTKVTSAKPIENGGKIGGAYNQKTKTAHLPVGNNYYHRTIRLHESLHAIYTKRKPGKGGYTNLEQGLEDARLHLLKAKTSGRVRRDEIATALRDLRRIPASKDLAAILALRSAAILQEFTTTEVGELAKKKWRAMAESVSPEYYKAICDALAALRRGKWDDAVATLKPFFDEAKPEEQTFPSIEAKMFGDGDGEDSKTFADVSFAKLEGKLTSEAADMLSKGMTRSIEDAKRLPKLNIHQIFANANVPTFFGELDRHTLTGSKIDAKRLALCVGPAMPRLFTKTIHRNGGTVVIDASGSMGIEAWQLLKLLTTAPLATVAFYNCFNDDSWIGNLWIFAHKGKRAVDLRDVAMGPVSPMRGSKGRVIMDARGRYSYPPEHEITFGSGNVVDFQVLQWLLAQPAPRYILTDGAFVGPSSTSNYAASELLGAAIARKKLTQIISFEEMGNVLAKASKGRVAL